MNSFEVLCDFQNTPVHIGRYSAVRPRAHHHLRARHFRAEIPRGVAQRLADRVDTDECAGVQEVLASNVALAHRVDLCPLGVRIIREEFLGSQLILGVAVGRCGGGCNRDRGRAILESLNVVVVVVVIAKVCLCGNIGIRRAICRAVRCYVLVGVVCTGLIHCTRRREHIGGFACHGCCTSCVDDGKRFKALITALQETAKGRVQKIHQG